MKLRTSDSKVVKQFKEKGVPVEVLFSSYENRSIRYIQTADDTSKQKPLVIFVHGAPGSSDNFYQFMQDPSLIAKYDMISVDRLGYGYSDFGNSETDITKQAECLKPIVDNFKDRKLILVGHSYGGPVIARFAMNYPQLVNGLLFLAPAIDPNNEKIFWISHLGRIYPTRWLSPASLRVATDEKFSHEVELRKMEKDWDKIKSKVVYIHGNKDGLVPYINLEYAVAKMGHLELDTITVSNGGHLLPWKNQGLIIEQLNSMLD